MSWNESVATLPKILCQTAARTDFVEVNELNSKLRQVFMWVFALKALAHCNNINFKRFFNWFLTERKCPIAPIAWKKIQSCL